MQTVVLRLFSEPVDKWSDSLLSIDASYIAARCKPPLNALEAFSLFENKPLAVSQGPDLREVTTGTTAYTWIAPPRTYMKPCFPRALLVACTTDELILIQPSSCCTKHKPSDLYGFSAGSFPQLLRWCHGALPGHRPTSSCCSFEVAPCTSFSIPVWLSSIPLSCKSTQTSPVSCNRFPLNVLAPGGFHEISSVSSFHQDDSAEDAEYICILGKEATTAVMSIAMLKLTEEGLFSMKTFSVEFFQQDSASPPVVVTATQQWFVFVLFASGVLHVIDTRTTTSLVNFSLFEVMSTPSTINLQCSPDLLHIAITLSDGNSHIFSLDNLMNSAAHPSSITAMFKVLHTSIIGTDTATALASEDLHEETGVSSTLTDTDISGVSSKVSQCPESPIENINMQQSAFLHWYEKKIGVRPVLLVKEDRSIAGYVLSVGNNCLCYTNSSEEFRIWSFTSGVSLPSDTIPSKALPLIWNSYNACTFLTATQLCIAVPQVQELIDTIILHEPFHYIVSLASLNQWNKRKLLLRALSLGLQLQNLSLVDNALHAMDQCQFTSASEALLASLLAQSKGSQFAVELSKISINYVIRAFNISNEASPELSLLVGALVSIRGVTADVSSEILHNDTNSDAESVYQEVAQSFPPFTRWDGMQSVELVQEGVQNNILPSVIGYLCWKNPTLASSSSMQWVYNMGIGVCYKILCSGDVNLAVLVLRRLGYEEPLQPLSDIAVSTCSRSLRWDLVQFLINAGEKSISSYCGPLTDWARLLENLYTEHFVFSEYIRLIDGKTNSSRTILQNIPDPYFICDNLDSLPSCAQDDFCLIQSGFPVPDLYQDRTKMIVPCEKAGVSTSGYAYFCLKWIRSWSESSKERVLFEKDIVPASNALSLPTYLQYLLSHNCWAVLASLIYSLKTCETCEVSLDTYMPLEKCGLNVTTLEYSSTFLREMILDAFAETGHFVENELTCLKSPSNTSSASFPHVLRRMASIGHVFSNRCPHKQPHRNILGYLVTIGCFTVAMEYISHLQPPMLGELTGISPWIELFIQCINSTDNMLRIGCLNACLILHNHDTDVCCAAPHILSELLTRSSAANSHSLILLALSQYVRKAYTLPPVYNQYPTLSKALLACSEAHTQEVIPGDSWNPDILSSNKDTKLSSLLEDTTLFHHVNTLRNHKTSFIDDELEQIAPKFGFDLEYYLFKGHPAQALSIKPSEQSIDLVKQLALKNLNNAKVVTACVCYLELAGCDTFDFRVDLAAKSILLNSPRFADSANQISASTIDEKTAIRLADEMNEYMNDTQISPTDMKRRIVPLFCKTHGIAVNRKHFTFLAETAAVIPFLFVAHVEGYSIQETLEVVCSSWKHAASKEHILLAINRPLQPVTCIPATCPENIVRAAQYIKNADSWHSPLHPLLILALNQCCDTNDPATITKLFLLWLHASFSSVVSQPDINESLEGLQKKQSQAVIALITIKKYLHLETAFSLFDATNPLLHIVLGLKYFRQFRFKEAKAQLRLFSGREKPDIAIVTCSTCLDVSLHQFFEESNFYGLGKFVRIAAETQLNRNSAAPSVFAQLHTTFCLLQKNDLPISLINSPPQVILDELKARTLFEEAVQYAADNGLNSQPVLIAEANYILNQYKSGCLWRITEERIKLWRRLHIYFLQHNAEPETAGNFFMSFADGKLCEHLTEQLDKKELLELLCVGYSWYSGLQSHYINASVTPPGKPMYQQSSCKTTVFMKELETRILLLNICIQAGLEFVQQWNSVTPSVMDDVIVCLLNSGKIETAKEIAAKLRHSSFDLATVEVMISVVYGRFNWLPSSMPKDVAAALSTVDSTGTVLLEQNPLNLLILLSKMAKKAYPCCHGILVSFRVATELEIPYVDMCNTSSTLLLQQLLQKGQESYALCADFIANAPDLTSVKVAAIIADHYVDWISRKESQQEGIDLQWPRGSFVELVSLCTKPSAIADRLCDKFLWWDDSQMLSMDDSILTPPSRSEMPVVKLIDEAEVEVSISAYICYDLGGSTDSCRQVLDFVHSRVQAYVEKKKFKLLFRLLVGTRAYKELQYIFDILIDAGQFDLLLKRDKLDPAGEGDGLQRALVSHFKQQRPRDKDKLHLVCLRYGLHHDIATSFEDHARTLLKGLFPENDKRALPPVSGTARYTFEQGLVSAMQPLMQASGHFVTERAYTSASEALNHAALVALQMRRPDIRVLSLPISSPDDWVGPLYQQSVINGNIDYLWELRQYVRITETVYRELTKKFQSDPLKQQRVKQFKRVIETTSDVFLQYEIAGKAGFTDLASQLESKVPGLKYFKKPFSDAKACPSSPAEPIEQSM